MTSHDDAHAMTPKEHRQHARRFVLSNADSISIGRIKASLVFRGIAYTDADIAAIHEQIGNVRVAVSWDDECHDGRPVAGDAARSAAVEAAVAALAKAANPDSCRCPEDNCTCPNVYQVNTSGSEIAGGSDELAAVTVEAAEPHIRAQVLAEIDRALRGRDMTIPPHVPSQTMAAVADWLRERLTG